MECGFLLPPSAPYKGAEWWLGRPAPPIKAEEGQATGADPLPRPASDRFPASTAATPSAWRPRGRRAEPRRQVRRPLPNPAIMGSGRPESRASTPFVHRTAPPRLPPFMAEVRITLFIVT